mmetsp:Transcript_33195/g.82166  ORF Transcript_33195/g.82166 Transcript_33195/m.82166 type:complete len:240 (+) Transcript_33195:826-1545(+)
MLPGRSQGALATRRQGGHSPRAHERSHLAAGQTGSLKIRELMAQACTVFVFVLSLSIRKCLRTRSAPSPEKSNPYPGSLREVWTASRAAIRWTPCRATRHAVWPSSRTPAAAAPPSTSALPLQPVPPRPSNGFSPSTASKTEVAVCRLATSQTPLEASQLAAISAASTTPLTRLARSRAPSMPSPSCQPSPPIRSSSVHAPQDPRHPFTSGRGWHLDTQPILHEKECVERCGRHGPARG